MNIIFEKTTIKHILYISFVSCMFYRFFQTDFFFYNESIIEKRHMHKHTDRFFARVQWEEKISVEPLVYFVVYKLV